MPTILGIIGLLELMSGIGVFATAKSAIHEILGILFVGFAFMTMALAAILFEIRRLVDRTPKLPKTGAIKAPAEPPNAPTIS